MVMEATFRLFGEEVLLVRTETLTNLEVAVQVNCFKRLSKC